MAELQERRHGLESFLATAAETDGGTVGVEIRLQADLSYINLRGDPKSSEFKSAAKSAIGQALPAVPNTMSGREHRIFWLGPNEWLIVTSASLDLIPRLRGSLAGQHASVTDVTGGQIGMLLSGQGVRDVLAKGCTLDFHPGIFTVGSCAQSGLAKANVLIGLVDDRPTFQMIVRRSFAEYLALWLRNAAREHGVKFSVN